MGNVDVLPGEDAEVPLGGPGAVRRQSRHDYSMT